MGDTHRSSWRSEDAYRGPARTFDHLIDTRVAALGSPDSLASIRVGNTMATSGGRSAAVSTPDLAVSVQAAASRNAPHRGILTAHTAGATDNAVLIGRINERGLIGPMPRSVDS